MSLRHDVCIAVRSLRRSPGFTAVAVLSLALGTGANTAIFSLVNAILLASLPVPRPQELRMIRWTGVDPRIRHYSGSLKPAGAAAGTGTARSRVGVPPGTRLVADAFTYPLFLDLRRDHAAEADLFGYTPLPETSLRAREGSFLARGLMVSGNFFSALGVWSLHGRLFAMEDEAPGAPPVVVISQPLWRDHFGLDPAVLGQPLTLNGRSYSVVGVAPHGFAGPSPDDAPEFYVPTAAQPHLMPDWPSASSDHWWVKLMARVPAAHSDASLRAALGSAFAARNASVIGRPGIELADGRAGTEGGRDTYRRPLLILLGAVAMTLLVACANVAALSLVRGAAQRHERAVRVALGASRWHLVRRSLVESLLLALLGGGLGMVWASWGSALVSRLLAGSAEGLKYEVSPDWTLAGFAFAIVLVATLLSGLLPALRTARADSRPLLADRSAIGAPRLRLGRVLVTAQIALSVPLVVGAGLFVRSFVNLARVDPGFATEDLLLAKLDPNVAGLRGRAATAFFIRVQESVARIPGVRGAAIVQHKLLGGWMSGGSFFRLPAHPEMAGKKPQAHRLTVSETFFDTMAIAVSRGRGFTPADVDGAPKVVVVNETFVQSYMAGGQPLGQVLEANGADWQIVGVCGDARYTGLKTEVPPTVYFSHRQDGLRQAYIAVRTGGRPLALASAVRKAVAAISPEVPLADVTTQATVRDQAMAHESMLATLCGGLAAVALALACIGLFGLMAYDVARRTREIGLRIALGATTRETGSAIVGQAFLLALAGLAIGMPAAFGLGRIVEGQLYGVGQVDPAAFIGGALLLTVMASLAAYIPARRAARVDPMEALRCE